MKPTLDDLEPKIRVGANRHRRRVEAAPENAETLSVSVSQSLTRPLFSSVDAHQENTVPIALDTTHPQEQHGETHTTCILWIRLPHMLEGWKLIASEPGL